MTGTGEPSKTGADMMALTLRLIAASREYGFSQGAAFSAAYGVADGIDARTLTGVVAALASFIGTDLTPRSGISLELWLEAMSFALAVSERDE